MTTDVTVATAGPNAIRTLPVEIKPGIFWLGGCVPGDVDGRPLHSSHHQFLIVGDDAVLLVDTWFPSMWPELEHQLHEVLGDRPVDYVFVTHQEIPHCGNIPRLLQKYPGSKIVGDTRDYHLYFPRYADRFEHDDAGDAIDLGGAHRAASVNRASVSRAAAFSASGSTPGGRWSSPTCPEPPRSSATCWAGSRRSSPPAAWTSRPSGGTPSASG